MDQGDRKTASHTSALSNTSTINNNSITTEHATISSASSASVPFNNNTNTQQPQSTSYHDKHLKDTSLHQFDRNLTIERATFEPSQQQTPRIVPSPQKDQNTTTTAANRNDTHDSTLSDTAITNLASTAQPLPTRNSQSISTVEQLPSEGRNQRSQYDTFTTLSPEKPLATTMKISGAIPHSPPRSGQANNKTKPPMKNEAEKQSPKKNRKLPGASGTATPSEVFHRNLVDAVSNVEDSDENEQYVYPYSHHDPSSISTTTTNTAKSNKNRNQQKNRYPYTRASGSSLSLYQPRPSTSHYQYNSTGSLLRYSTDNRHGHTIKHQHSSSLSPQQLQQRQQDYYRYGSKYQQQLSMPSAASPMVDEECGPWIKRDYHRPKLRSHVMDHNALPQTWAHEVSSSDDEDDGEVDDIDNYNYSPGNERMYLLRHARQHPRSGISCARVLGNICISVLVFIVMMMILTVFRAEPLTDVSASMEHVLASDKELIFDLVVRANNWNFWQIRIRQADLSVFAFSQLTTLNNTFGVDPAEYLGGFQSFDQPLSFTSSAILGPHQQANTSSQIRIKSPGADSSGNQRWSRMIRYPFGLVIRGVLKYRPLPLFNLSPRQSIPLCIVTYIDPISPTPSSLSDFSYNDSYCSHYPSVSPLL